MTGIFTCIWLFCFVNVGTLNIPVPWVRHGRGSGGPSHRLPSSDTQYPKASKVLQQLNSLGIQSYSQLMIRVSNHLRNAYYLGSITGPFSEGDWIPRDLALFCFLFDVFVGGNAKIPP